MALFAWTTAKRREGNLAVFQDIRLEMKPRVENGLEIA
jgi:hypothetical protein